MARRSRYNRTMGKRLASGFLWGLLGYFVGAVGGGMLVYWLSTTVSDRLIESTMTGLFVTGPLLASVGFAIGFVRARPAATVPPAAPTRGHDPR